MAEKKIQFRTQQTHKEISNLERMGDACGNITPAAMGSLILSEAARLVDVKPNVTSADVWALLSRISDEIEILSLPRQALEQPHRAEKKGRAQIAAAPLLA